MKRMGHEKLHKQIHDWIKKKNENHEFAEKDQKRDDWKKIRRDV